jgi:hypothetical protein
MGIEQGLSGAWVVRGPCLIGMIIAVYEDEPYAHVLPISSIFTDIRALLSNGDHVPQVSLPERSMGYLESDTAMGRNLACSHVESCTASTSSIATSSTSSAWSEKGYHARSWPSRNKNGNQSSEWQRYSSEKSTHRDLQNPHKSSRYAVVYDWIGLVAITLAVFCIHLVRSLPSPMTYH